MTQGTLAEFCDKVGEIMPIISREFFRHQTSEFFKTKITLPQFVVLEVLSRHGESKMTDIARYINVTTAAITGIVERLVRDGYALRISDPKDRRIVKVKLTKKGEGILQKMAESKKAIVMRIFGVISQEERDEYLKILEHIQRHLAGQEK